MQQVEGFIDVGEIQVMRDEAVQVDFAVHEILNHSGQFRAAFDTAECRTSPDASCHQLERTGMDLFAGSRDTDDDAFAQPLWQASKAAFMTSTFPMHSKL